MSQSSPEAHVQALADARRESEERLRGVPMEFAITPATGRRVKDELSHVACWEAEVCRSLEAALGGGEHVIPAPFDIDAINDRFYEAHRHEPDEEVVQRWHLERARFADCVARLDATAEVTCPWGRREPIADLVRDMVGHERAHVDRIAVKWQAGQDA